MFPTIADISEVIALAQVQNNIGNYAIQRGLLNHRNVDYRVFRIPVSQRLDKDAVISAYYRELNFFSLTVVTSVARYHEGELVLAVPVVSLLIQPFQFTVDKDRMVLEMDINIRDTITECSKEFINPTKLVLSIETYHIRNELRAEPFSGIIEGNFFRTLRARWNRSRWPVKVKVAGYQPTH